MFNNVQHLNLMSKICTMLDVNDRKMFLSELMEMSDKEIMLFNFNNENNDMLKSMVCDFEVKNHRTDMSEANKGIMNDVINNPNQYTYSELAKKYNRKYSQVTNFISKKGLTDKIRKVATGRKTGKITSQVKNELFAFLNNN